MALPPQDDPTRKVRRIGWAVIIVFAAIILALFVVLIFVDPDDDEDEPEESGRAMPEAGLVEYAVLDEAAGGLIPAAWVRLGVAERDRSA